MNLILHLKFIGISMIVLSLIHMSFPKRFKWSSELKTLSLINRQMMMVHTFFIALTVGLSGLLLVWNAEDLVKPSSIGKSVSLGLLVFWGFRMLIQFFVYDRRLWSGKRFETIIHIVFSVTWIYYTAVFAMLLLKQYQLW